MSFSDRFYAYLKAKSEERGWQTRFAREAGISQDALHKIITGKTKKPEMPIIAKIVDTVGLEALYPEAFMSRVGNNSPREAIQGDNLPIVPVYGSAGAGAEMELFSGEPETFIQVLPQYMMPDLAALRVDGDSMEPTIKCGSYVGVVPFDGMLSEGGIYLVSIPPFGRLIKRIRMGDDGSIILMSDNEKYPEKPIPYEDYDNVVIGRVAWVWQLF